MTIGDFHARLRRCEFVNQSAFMRARHHISADDTVRARLCSSIFCNQITECHRQTLHYLQQSARPENIYYFLRSERFIPLVHIAAARAMLYVRARFLKGASKKQETRNIGTMMVCCYPSI